MNMFLIQVIGGIAYLLLATSYFKKDKASILLIQIFAYLGFMIHYYLLNGTTAVICNGIGLIVFLIIYIFEKKKIDKNKLLIVITIPSLVIISALTYQNIYSIFPIIASVISISSFLTSNENLIRFVGIISAICWGIYAIVYKSYVSIGFEIFTITFTIIAFIKMKKTS